MTTRVAEVMVEVLIRAGAKRCYGVPGDTLNYFTDAVRRSDLRWVHVRHEEAGAMAAGADALLTGELTLCAGSCGPGSLHFINGLWESNRNRAPVVLIASQITRDELGFEFPQEVDFKSIYGAGTVFCEEIRTPSQARRMTAMAAQAALSRKGVAVLIVPVDVSRAHAPDEPYFGVHPPHPSSGRATTSLTGSRPRSTRAVASRSMAAQVAPMPTTRWSRLPNGSRHRSPARREPRIFWSTTTPTT